VCGGLRAVGGGRRRTGVHQKKTRTPHKNVGNKNPIKAKSQVKPKPKAKSQVGMQMGDVSSKMQQFWLQNAANSKGNCIRLKNNKQLKKQKYTMALIV